MLLATSVLIVILSRLGILLTLVHFLWTFSEIHARIVAYLWFVMMIGELSVRLIVNKKGDKDGK